MLESQYQARLIKKLERKFPGCVILKNDAGYRQGIPDLVILYFGRWAALEVKVDEHAPHQANQDWWVERMNDMAYASFIFPSNERKVLREISLALEP